MLHHIIDNVLKAYDNPVKSRGVSYGVCCLQLLVQHINAVLPGLKERINNSLASVAKEHAGYGEVTESKVYLEHFAHSFVCV